LGFDSKSGEARAVALQQALIHAGVEVRPLMRGSSQPYLDEHALELSSSKAGKQLVLLVILNTSTYGGEPKHQVEAAALLARQADRQVEGDCGAGTAKLVVELGGGVEGGGLEGLLRELKSGEAQLLEPSGWLTFVPVGGWAEGSLVPLGLVEQVKALAQA